MSDTTYIDYVQPAVSAEWLNEINNHVWHDTPTTGTTVHAANKIEVTPFDDISATDVQAALNEINDKIPSINPIDASEVSYVPNGTGAVTSNVQNKLRELISVKDFGAVGDGVTDDTVALQNAIIHAYTVGIGYVYIPKNIKLTATVNLYPYVKLIGAGSSTCRITTSLVTGTLFLAIKPIGYVPSLNIGCGLIGVTIVGNTGIVGVDLSEAKLAEFRDVEFGNCKIGLAFNKKSTEDALPFGGQAYFNKITQCSFASCTTAVKFYGAANRNTFDTNTYNSCTTAFDFGQLNNVSETNVSINDNIEGCHAAFEWPSSTIYGQTWIGLTVENPVSNGYVCTVKDPGRQLFVNLALIPSNTPTVVDFYKINTDYSSLLGSKSSSSGFSYGMRVVEDLYLYKPITNKAYYGSTTYSNAGIAVGASATTTITVTGAVANDAVKLSANKDLLGCILTGYVSGTNTVTVRIQNGSGGNVVLSSVIITAIVEKLA